MLLPFAPHLTPRELQLLGLIASGCTNAQIADRMCVARHTVDNYVSRLLAKWHARNRTQLVVKFLKRQRKDHERLWA